MQMRRLATVMETIVRACKMASHAHSRMCCQLLYCVVVCIKSTHMHLETNILIGNNTMNNLLALT